MRVQCGYRPRGRGSVGVRGIGPQYRPFCILPALVLPITSPKVRHFPSVTSGGVHFSRSALDVDRTQLYLRHARHRLVSDSLHPSTSAARTHPLRAHVRPPSTEMPDMTNVSGPSAVAWFLVIPPIHRRRLILDHAFPTERSPATAVVRTARRGSIVRCRWSACECIATCHTIRRANSAGVRGTERLPAFSNGARRVRQRRTRTPLHSVRPDRTSRD